MILIAGGSGFYGINTARCLADRGEEVLLVHRHAIQPPPLLASYWGKQVKQATGDILDLAVLMNLAKTYSVDSIIHTAFREEGGKEGVFWRARLAQQPHILRTQTLHTQIDGAMNCFEVACLLDLRRITFVSSVGAYSGLPHPCEVFEEDAYLPPLASSEVGAAKRCVEQIGSLYAKQYGLSFVSIRPPLHWGMAVTDSPANVMIESALAGKVADIPVPSNQRNDLINAKDAAEAVCLVHLVKSLKNCIYNVSSGINSSWQEFADAVKQVIPTAKIKLGPPEKKVEIRPVMRIERIKEELGFVPMTLKQSVEQYANWLKTGKY